MLNKKNKGLRQYLSNQSLQILTLVIISLVLSVGSLYLYLLPALEESYYNSRKKLLHDMVSSAEGLVFDYYKRYESGELTEFEAKSRLLKRLNSMKYDGNNGYFWVINDQAMLVSHPYSLNILGKKLYELENTPEKEVLLNMNKLGRDSSEGFVFYKWTSVKQTNVYRDKVAYIKLFKPWGYIIGTGAYIDDIKVKVAELNSNINTTFTIIAFIMFGLSVYIIRNTRRLNSNKELAYKELFATENKFRIFFDSTFQFIAVLDKYGYIKEINKSASDFISKDKQALIGKLFWETEFWELDIEAKLNLISAFREVQNGKFIRFEATHQNINGKKIIVDFSLKPIYDGKGEFFEVIAEGRDISESKKVESDLKKSQERLAKVLNQSPMATLIFDLNGDLMYSNEAWEQLWTSTTKEQLGFNVYNDLQHSKFGYKEYFDKAKQGISSAIGPFLFQQLGNLDDKEEMKWLYSFVYPLTENNLVTEIVILYEDQTQRMKISQALEQSEHWYRSLFDNAIDGILIMENDIIKEANPEFFRLFSSTPEKMKGKSIYNFMPETQYKGENSIQKAKEITSAVIAGNSAKFTFLHQKEDGLLFDAEIAITKINNDNDKLVLAFFRDVSDRKRAYDAIQSVVEAVAAYTGQEFFNSIALNLNKILKSDFAFIGVKQDEKTVKSISLANKDKIIGNLITEIEGTPSKNVLEYGMSVYHEDVAGIFPQDNILKDLSIEGYVGTPLIGSDNEVIGVLLALFQRPIEDDLLSKEILQIFAGRIAAEIERANYQNELISLNKTLEKRIQDRTSELQNINTELKDFAYIVSHDLKAPLRGISQLSEWIRTDIEEKLESENIEMFDLLQSRIKKMYTLIDGVLDYSRVGRIEEQAEEIDLNKLIQEIFDLVKDERNSEIKINHVLPVIKADKTRISQIYQNLISNAFKYNDKKEVLLNLGYSEDSNYHYFSIEDNGIGIDEKYFKKIFNIFQTIDGNNEESSGIGLSIAKKIVEFYGGSISLESEISKGSKFSFSISKSKVKL